MSRHEIGVDLVDIDRIISRTIGYTIVSAVLFAAFWGANLFLLGAINIARGSHPVVVAGTTLVVAALFSPLRSRIQRVVDRRFDRARYDAEQTAERFVGRLRDELGQGPQPPVEIQSSGKVIVPFATLPPDASPDDQTVISKPALTPHQPPAAIRPGRH